MRTHSSYSRQFLFLGLLMLTACGGGGSDSTSSSGTGSSVTVPSAPTGLTATPADSSVSLAFTAPASNGGAAISGYSASCSAGGTTRTATGTSSPITVNSLTNGTSYSCTVSASNSAGSGAAATAVTVTPAATVVPSAYNPLWIPPTLDGTTSNGITQYNLTLAASSKQMMTGAKTNTLGFNGADFWGPTLILTKGVQTRLQLQNNLSESTTTHWHGLLVPGTVDGGPHQIIAAGATWTTDAFVVKNQASTFWYHPHLHGSAQRHLTLGAGGLIIVRDAAEAALNLPRTYGTDDIPLVLTSVRFTTSNGTANQLQTSAIAYGDYQLANGIQNAQITLPRQVVRLRLLNAEIEREYNVGFSDNRTFQVIGSDGGLLTTPVSLTRLVMAPGERYEILVNLGNDSVGSTLDLQAYNGADSGLSFGFAGLEDASSGEFGSLLNYKTFRLLHINVGAATSSPVLSLPTSLVSNTLPAASDATSSRNIVVTGGQQGAAFSFNNVFYDFNTINQTVTAGATESWTVNAGSIFSHSFHIHGVQFHVVARNGSAANVKAYEQGWKDTLYVPIAESVTFVTRFDETADSSYPFMYHCHMSNHEDGGLMGQFVVR
jgi:blue copper oxidase